MKRTSNEPVRVRIYGKLVREWFADWKDGRQLRTQVEYAYTDYDEDGHPVGVGTEDFSNERFNKHTRLLWIFTWDGQKRNYGGKRWFCPEGTVRIRNVYGERGRVINVLKKIHSGCTDAVEVQLRG